MCANMMKEKDIKKIDWPTHFSILHFIEDIWEQEKEMLSSKQKEFKTAEKKVQKIAQREIAKV